MSANVVEVDTFTDPIVVPVAGEGVTAAAVLAYVQGLTNRTRRLKNGLHTSPVVIPASAFRPASGTITAFGFTGSPDSFVSLKMLEASAYAVLDLGPYLPDGVTLNTVEIRVLPGAARAGTDRMRAVLGKSNFADGSGDAATFSDAYDNGAASEQVITVSPAWVIDKGAESYTFAIRTGNTGDVSPDYIYLARVSYT